MSTTQSTKLIHEQVQYLEFSLKIFRRPKNFILKASVGLLQTMAPNTPLLKVSMLTVGLLPELHLKGVY